MPRTGSIEQLAYLGFEVSDTSAWQSFATEVLGLGLAGRSELARRSDDGSFALRMDGHEQRFIVSEGPRDDLAFVGWQVESAGVLEDLGRHLSDSGFDVTKGTPEEARARRVERFVRFRDPGGIPVELCVGAERSGTDFVSDVVRSGFVADRLGLGHLVISTRDRDESVDFYTKTLGFALSDYIVTDIGGYHVDIAFLHTNGRHHSLALGGTMPKRIHHFMLEVGAMDEVGLALDRAEKHRVPIEQGLGRHPNDKMFSFYGQTPSGFQFEYGWGGRIVGDGAWEPTTYDCVSEWGHRRPPRPRQKR